MITASVLVCLLATVAADDLFNYRSTSGNDYGPEDWGKVSCDNLETCVSSCGHDDILQLYSRSHVLRQNRMGGP